MDFLSFYYQMPLFEGGNVTVKGKDMGGNVEVNDIKAQKIPIDQISAKQYREIQDQIVETLKALNKAFEEEYDKPLFPKFEDNVKNGKIFSGSTRLFFSKEYDEFSKHKKSVGDIDIQYPQELRPLLKEFLKKIDGKKFGKMTYLGQGGRSPTQENTLFKSTVVPKLVQNIQIDFEPTFWEKGVPTDFSTFAHYSSWEDIKNKVKGAFSKLLMRALISSKQKLGDIAVVTDTGKISKSKKYEDPSMRKFSVDKGMRVAFEPVLDDKGNIQKSPDGKPMYKEIDTKKSVYERDIEDIFSFVFGKTPNTNEKKDFHSFIGILKLMSKYLNDKEINLIFDKFMDIIWKNGQEIEQGEFDSDGIQVNDFNTKKAAYDMFIKEFPKLKMSDKELKQYVLPFYQNLKNRKAS